MKNRIGRQEISRLSLLHSNAYTSVLVIPTEWVHFPSRKFTDPCPEDYTRAQEVSQGRIAPLLAGKTTRLCRAFGLRRNAETGHLSGVADQQLPTTNGGIVPGLTGDGRESREFLVILRSSFDQDQVTFLSDNH